MVYTQKKALRDRFNEGYCIANIASELKLPQHKVQTYVDNTFITFSGKEGKNVEYYSKSKLLR